MTQSLSTTIVAHFESRRRGELDNLIRRHGGAPWSAPALSEVPVELGIAEKQILDRFCAGRFDLIVLLTGVGTQRLLDEAAAVGKLAEAKWALASAVTVARGPKPVFALRQQDLKPTIVAPEPNTTRELLDTLAAIPVAGRETLILSAGEIFAEPAATLRARGARTEELRLYRWDLTDTDAARVEQTIDEIVAGGIAAVLFTTQVQVRHVFDVAARKRRLADLIDALRDRVIVGAVGPTCATALRERGVAPHVIPEHPKMGHLVLALAAFIPTSSVERTA
jgi:uroporphyrinogen-III synthase